MLAQSKLQHKPCKPGIVMRHVGDGSSISSVLDQGQTRPCMKSAGNLSVYDARMVARRWIKTHGSIFNSWELIRSVPLAELGFNFLNALSREDCSAA